MTEVNCAKLRQIAPEKFRRAQMLFRLGRFGPREFHASRRSAARAAAQTVEKARVGVLAVASNLS